jgi:hypothetical protein
MKTRSMLLIVASLLLCAISHSGASEFYEWTDENGVRHFATSLAEVPERYRNQVTQPDAPRPRPADARPAPPALAPAPAEAVPGLAKFEVPYEPFEGSARRVIVEVTFNGRVKAPMAIETGSPGMVVSFELAEKLGLFSGGGGNLLVQAAGIGGTAPGVLTIVDSVTVGDARASFIPTTVTDGISDAFDGLIGMDFLANYTFHVDAARQVVVFEEIPASENSRGGRDEAWWRNTFTQFRGARDHWKAYAASLEGKLGASERAFAEFQARESERLLQRLEVYASNLAVPRHWR